MGVGRGHERANFGPAMLLMFGESADSGLIGHTICGRPAKREVTGLVHNEEIGLSAIVVAIQ
jgi:hypothetical protein